MLSHGLALLLAMALGNASTGPEDADVTVVYRYEVSPTPEIHQALQEEAARLLPMRVGWQVLDDSASQRVYRRLVVVRFSGVCRADREPPAAKDTSLARTMTVDHKVQPFVEVECDRVRAFLNGRTPAAIGVALGRVLAHEVYHVLLRTSQHGASGVSQARFSRSDLLRPDLRFSPEEQDALRSISGITQQAAAR